MGGAAARDPSARAGLNSGPRRGGSRLARRSRDRLDAWDAGLVSSNRKPSARKSKIARMRGRQVHSDTAPKGLRR